MANDVPVLSVTVLNYNYGHFLRNCLDSILKQSFTNFELIVINDKSTDNSVEVIRPYLADSRVRLIDHVENKGFVRSLIEGVDESKGRYVSVISADDWVVSDDAFARQVAALEQDPGVVFAYGSYGVYSNHGEAAYHHWRPQVGDYVRDGYELFRELLLAPYILHSGTIIRATAMSAVGGYDRTLKYAVDTRMWLSLCRHGKGAYIDGELYGYRRHLTSMSKSLSAIEATIREVLRVIDESVDAWPPEQRAQLLSLRDDARKRALIAYALDEAFSGRRRESWRGLAAALRVDPMATLVQKDSVILALRATLGEKAFGGLRSLSGQLRGRRLE